MSGRTCLCCGDRIDGDGYFELIRQPSGDLYTVCSMRCLTAFVRGEPVTA